MTEIYYFSNMCRSFFRYIISLSVVFATAFPAVAISNWDIKYSVSAEANAGSGEFAPYYITANRHGKTISGNGFLTEALFESSADSIGRFRLQLGMDFAAAFSRAIDYERYNSSSDSWENNRQRTPYVWIQQAYCKAGYRSLFLTAGMKNYHSMMVNDRLSSGDLTRSSNSRSLPGVSAGIDGFRKVPFTNGWVEIEGELSYSKFIDNKWWRNHFNRYTNHIAQGQWLVYRRLYLQSDAGKALSGTLGIQASTQFGGYTEYYHNGKLTEKTYRSSRPKDFLKVLLPTGKGSEDFRIGNTLGSIDLSLRYRLRSGQQIKFYLQNPWEDGSGLAKRNGFDGLCGVEYTSPHRSIVTGAVIEYLDMTNQSGPVHWAPGFVPGTDLNYEATGADDYYNNYYYNPYANYGLIMGSPLVMSPVYNTDGYPGVLTNRMRAIHAGIEGCISSDMCYRMLFNYRKAWGSGYVPLLKSVDSFSMMAEVTYYAPSVRGLRFDFRFGIDRGKLPENASGGMIAISYSGNFQLK